MNERQPGVWTLRVFVGRDAGGRPVQDCRGSKRESETALAKYVAELSEGKPALEASPNSEEGDQARSKRSRFMTLSHATTKSRTNFSFESSHA